MVVSENWEFLQCCMLGLANVQLLLQFMHAFATVSFLSRGCIHGRQRADGLAADPPEGRHEAHLRVGVLEAAPAAIAQSPWRGGDVAFSAQPPVPVAAPAACTPPAVAASLAPATTYPSVHHQD